MPLNISNRYNFASPGAAALDSLAQAEADRRKAMMDEVLLSHQKAQTAALEASTKANETWRQAQAEQLNQLRAQKILAALKRGDMLTPDDAEFLKEQGLGSSLSEVGGATLPSTSIQGGASMPGTPGTSAAPDTGQITKQKVESQAAPDVPKQFAYLGSPEQRMMADLADSLATVKTREEAARMALKSGVPLGQIDDFLNAAYGRKTIKEGGDEKDAAARKLMAEGNTIDTLNDLNQMVTVDEKGNPTLTDSMKSLYGGMRFGAFAAVPGVNNLTGVADAKAIRDKVVSSLMIGLMTRMKEASKTGATGFGQLSEKEGEIIRNATTKLNNNAISEPEAAKEIMRLRDSMQRIIKYTETGVYTPPEIQEPAKTPGSAGKTPGVAPAAAHAPAAIDFQPDAPSGPAASAAPSPSKTPAVVGMPLPSHGPSAQQPPSAMAQVAPMASHGAAMPQEPPAPSPLEGQPLPSSSGSLEQNPAGVMPSPEGVSTLMDREKFSPRAYSDAGTGLAIGYGMHTVGGKPVQPGQTMTQPDAQAEMVKQIREYYAPAVMSALKVPVTQQQFDELISIAYNGGPGVAQRIIAKINAGIPLTEADFQKSATVKGKPNAGLKGRRKAEAAPFLIASRDTER